MVFRELVPFHRVRPSVMLRTNQQNAPLASLQRRMNRMFDDFFGDFGDNPLSQITAEAGDFIPQIDISENDTEYTITAELAGMEQKDIDIEVLDDTLVIKGEKKTEQDEKNEQSRFTERRYGKFSRSVALGANINQEAIEADFKNGVLTVRLPKAPAEKPEAKKISIKS